MTILILAEHSGGQLAPVTRHVVSAAKQIGGDIHILVAGDAASQQIASQASQIQGISKILHCSNDVFAQPLAENLVALVQPIATHYSHILAPATTFGKDVLPRLAALLDVMQVSDIVAVVTPDTFKRPIYAGNAIATVQSKDAIKLITVRGTAFDKAPDGGSAAIETITAPASFAASRFVSRQASSSERPELTSARVVVSGGRGLANGENFKLLEAIADKLGGAVGASRVAVDSGFVPNDYQVGQTGKIVAPDLYIAVGISGAIQHLAGMKESKVIVAINKDENAPIFEVADYGIVGDLFQVLPEIEKLL